MKLDDARKMKPGQWVICPPSGGQIGYTGKIIHIGTTVFRGKDKDDDYVWIVVHDRNTQSSHTWPSNLLK